jgi:CubicO group peptidase (beta-lactamase class C family)
MLTDEGRLNVDDRVAQHLSSFDNVHSGAITIRQVLNQWSGFVQGGLPEFQHQPTLRHGVDLAGQAGPTFPPGDRFVYSNLNSATVGALVEEIAGQPVERFIQTRILEPLGLEDTHTWFGPDSSWAPRVASSYRRWGAGPWERYWNNTRTEERAWFSPSGDLYATAFDYARFLAGWMDLGRYEDGRLLAEDTAREALADPLAGDTAQVRPRYYGFHWEIYAPPSRPGGLPVFGHRGATGTLGMAFPEQDVIVLYFTQSQENEVVDEVIEIALEMFGS